MNNNPAADASVIIATISTATDTALIAAPGAGKRIRVHGLRLSAAAAQKATIKAGTTALEAFNLVAGTVVNLPLQNQPYYTLPENTALNVTTTTTGATDGRIEYSVA